MGLSEVVVVSVVFSLLESVCGVLYICHCTEYKESSDFAPPPRPY